MGVPLDLREAFDLHPDAVYLNAAGEGPLPRVARAALLSSLELKSNPFRIGGEEYFQVPRRTREACAAIAGCLPDEIVLTTGTGAGINLAAAGLPLSPGDEVLFLKGDFPALLNPFLHARRRGVVAVEVAPAGKFPSVTDFQRAATPAARVLAISHVHHATGFRNDLAALGRFCRERGIFFVVDAAQSAGVLPIRFEEDGIDILAAPGHKWLLGLPGTGFAAIRAQVMERMTPPAVGWMGGLHHAAQFISVPSFDLSRFEGGRKFELGTTPFPQLSSWNASLDLLEKSGTSRVWEHVQALLDPLREYLLTSPYKLVSSPQPSHRSGILAFTGRFPAKLFLLLNERKIFPALRSGAIRISPHIYNTPEDTTRLIAALRELESIKVEADRKGENL